MHLSTLNSAHDIPRIDPMRYRILRTLFLAIVIAYGLVACSEEGSSRQAAWYSHNTIYSYSGTQGNLWDHIRKDLHMPSYANRRLVQQQIRFYQNHQQYLNHVIAESAPYIYFIYQKTKEHNLPAELALIPVIESDYNPYAKSNVGALGLWQMMPGTAQGFGLKKDFWYDGRKDVVASTSAALQYFTYLHSYFSNNWLLAVAAYDSGEGKVASAIHVNRSRGMPTDFWNLPLPNETRNYVPSLLAVADIVRSPAKYGIKLAPIDNAPYVEQVNVGSPIALSKAANLAEVPLSTMKVLNPGVQHGTTDPHGPYTILLPKNKAQTFKMKFAALTHNEKILWQQHVVKSKDTIESIAARYRINVASLRQANDLRNNHLIANQTLFIPPETNTPKTTEATQTAQAILAANSETEIKPVIEIPKPTENYYQVKKGDTLLRIASKQHIKIQHLLAWNNISSRHHHVKPGEKLLISDPKANSTPVEANSTVGNIANNEKVAMSNITKKIPDKEKVVVLNISYKVKRGDNINKIADKFKIKTLTLRKLNNLASNDTVIHPGQILKIPKGSIKSVPGEAVAMRD